LIGGPKSGKCEAVGQLNISKVAVGCASYEALRRRVESRAAGGVVPVVTRFRPTRADEVIGGSLYWIVKHRIVARQTILGFGTHEADRRTIIRLSSELVPVRALPKRAHQGWRYLALADAPGDLDGSEEDGLAALPPELASRLAGLALI
jgi:hypothetical protein